MAATEELRILLRTVADTSGVTKTEQSLKGVQAQAATTGRASAGSMVAFGAAAGGAATVVQAALQAAMQVAQFMGDSIQVAREHERVIRATTMAYGQQAQQYQQFAQQLSAATGFTSDAILEAALSARTLSQNYGLTIQQTQKLISVSADLARVRGIGIAEAFERVQSAIRGEAEASEYLGLTLNDTFLTNQAMNGSLKRTFGTMTDVQKAQVRYNELLKQSEQFSGLASKGTDSLDAAFGRVENSSRRVQSILGDMTKPAAIAGMSGLANAAKLLADSLERAAGVAPGASGPQRITLPSLGALGPEEDPLRRAQRQVQEAQKAGFDVTEATKADRARAAALTDLARRADAANKRLLELNTTFVPQGETAAQLARVAYWDQVDAAVRDVQSAQQAQVELQQQSVNLAAAEAQIRLSMLPAQERMAAIQRDVTEQQLRARRAALPATEALDNARAAAEHARLITADLGQPLERRQQAMRDLINLQLRSLPGLELGAFEANEPVRRAGQAAERVGIEAQLFQLTQERTLAQIQVAQQTNQLLSQIAEQRTQAILLTINMSSADFTQQVYKELIEANTQAQTVPSIPQSGVRR